MLLAFNRLRIITVAAICIGVVGCGSNKAISPEDTQMQAFDDLRESVQEVIANEQRQEAAIEIVNRLEMDYQKLIKAMVLRRADVRRLNADYDTTTESLSDFMNATEKTIQSNQQSVSRIHQELIAITTPEEWSLLNKNDTKSMDKLTNSLKEI